MSRVMAGILFCIAIASYVPAARAEYNLLPTPQHVTQGHGAFELRDSDVIAAPADARAQWIAGFLCDALRDQTGVDLRVVPAPERGRISLRIDPSIHGDEAYRQVVTSRSVTIAAADERDPIEAGQSPHPPRAAVEKRLAVAVRQTGDKSTNGSECLAVRTR